MNEKNQKEDCYFYATEEWSTQKIPKCTMKSKQGAFSCEGCDKYLSNAQVKSVVREHKFKGLREIGK